MTKIRQKGVALIIIFLIMTIILAVVLNVSVILFNEVKIVGIVGPSITAFYDANNAVEATLYQNRKQISTGERTGFCDICSYYSNSNFDPNIRWNTCTYTSLGTNGCSNTVCNNCQVNGTGAFPGGTFSATATLTPDAQDPNTLDFNLHSIGVNTGAARRIDLFGQNLASIRCNTSSDCEQSTDSNCGSNPDGTVTCWSGNPFCQANLIEVNLVTYTCNNPGTPSSYCSNTTSQSTLQTCTSACQNGGGGGGPVTPFCSTL